TCQRAHVLHRIGIALRPRAPHPVPRQRGTWSQRLRVRCGSAWLGRSHDTSPYPAGVGDGANWSEAMEPALCDASPATAAGLTVGDEGSAGSAKTNTAPPPSRGR